MFGLGNLYLLVGEWSVGRLPTHLTNFALEISYSIAVCWADFAYFPDVKSNTLKCRGFAYPICRKAPWVGIPAILLCI